MKNNRWFRTLMKIWVTIASVFAFLAGWIILGHSGKPVSASAISNNNSSSSAPAQLAPLPTLAPLPPFGSNQSLQPLPQQPSFNFSMPAPSFRTGGS